jgi:hypothetical protein
MNSNVTSTKEPYEKPVLLDLEEVVAGCGFCVTGGSNAIDDEDSDSTLRDELIR